MSIEDLIQKNYEKKEDNETFMKMFKIKKIKQAIKIK